MQGYGPRKRRFLTALTGAALACFAVVALPACSLLEIDETPSPIVIPETDAPITESLPSSVAPTSAQRSTGATGPASPWSFQRVIKAAPRASNSQFQIGATSESGDRSEVSGYHFSTEDRSVRCSTGNNGANTLACVGTELKDARRPADSDSSKCDWQPDYATLDANGATAGACANSYPVLFRSRILPSGSSLTIDRFACLADKGDLYCIESSSGKGFAITADGFEQIRSDERAPRALLGLTTENESSTERTPSSDVAPTR